MSYAEAVNLVLSILNAVIWAFFAYFIVFSIIGIFAKKKFPKAKEQHKYGVIIPARNEEKVVAGLIESVYKNKYPQDKLQVFVIAHNCTDKTAEIARNLGATVYEYNNPDERTMGYAFKHLFSCIEKDYGTANYDGFFLFNADNILDENYFNKMNDAFEARGCKDVITSRRSTKNFGSNTMAGTYGVYFLGTCRLDSRGRTVCDCSTKVCGTGYVIPSEIVKDGWKYVTLTEDWEFSADQILEGRKIIYCDEAVFYDEQPTTFKVMWRQRVRWSKGWLLVSKTRMGDCIKGLFKKSKKENTKVIKKVNRGSIWDIFLHIFPLPMVSVGLAVLQVILLAFAPLIQTDFVNVYKSFGIGLATGAAIGYAGMFAYAALIFIIERDCIKNIKWWQKILVCLYYPIFTIYDYGCQVVAVCSRNLVWKPIPHSDETKFEDLNQKDNKTEENSEEIVVIQEPNLKVKKRSNKVKVSTVEK